MVYNGCVWPFFFALKKDEMKQSKSLRLRLFITLIVMTITVSCERNEDIQPQYSNSTGYQEGMIKLGKKLENPYSVSNMQQAWDNLQKSNTNGRGGGNGMKVKTTHLYIKFIL